MPAQFRIACPECGHRLRGEERHLGKSVKCLRCGKKFTLDPALVAASPYQSPLATATQQPEIPDPAATVDASLVLVNLGETIDRPQNIETLATRPKIADAPNLGNVGRFVLRAKLGQGGFGTVYRAWDPNLSREVALKVPRFSASETHRTKRFLEEGKAAARLHHPNIVLVYETGQADDQFYIATEFVEGETLGARMKADAIPLATSIRWLRGIALGLQHAHDQGVVHRDVKPDNVMIGANGEPRVMDFGLAKRLGEDVSISTMTADGDVLGTPAYMSPEQARGDIERVGPKSDQYSLGVVMYELLTGQRPFQGPAYVVLNAILTTTPSRPSEIEPWLPRKLERICLTLMARDPNERYADLNAFVADLDRWAKGEEVEAAAVAQQVDAAPSFAIPESRGWAAQIRQRAAAIFFFLTTVFLLYGMLSNAEIQTLFWEFWRTSWGSITSPISGPLRRYFGGVFRFQDAWIYASIGSALVLLIPTICRFGSGSATRLMLISVCVTPGFIAVLALIVAPFVSFWSLSLWGLLACSVLNDFGLISENRFPRRIRQRITTAIGCLSLFLFLVLGHPSDTPSGLVSEVRSWSFLTAPLLVAWACREMLREQRRLWPASVVMLGVWVPAIVAGALWIPFDQYDPGRAWHATILGVLAAGLASVFVRALPELVRPPFLSWSTVPARLWAASVCIAGPTCGWLVSHDTFRDDWWIQLPKDLTVSRALNLLFVALLLFVASRIVEALVSLSPAIDEAPPPSPPATGNKSDPPDVLPFLDELAESHRAGREATGISGV